MPLRSFDTVVLGAGVGPAAAGALLARRGQRVLFALESAPSSGATAVSELMPPLRGGAAAAVFEDLKIGADVQRLWTPVGPMRVLLDGHRLTGPTTAELARELPGQAKVIAQALALLDALGDRAGEVFAEPPPLPPRGWGERRALRKLRAALGDDAPPPVPPPLGPALDALAPLASRLAGPPRTALARARAAAALLVSPGRFAGGEAGFAALLRRRAIESGAQVADVPSPAEALIVDGNRVTGVLLKGDVEVGCARLVVGLESAALVRLFLPLGRRARGFLADLAHLHPTERECSLAFVVRARAVPRPLGEVALVRTGPARALLEVHPVVEHGRPASASPERVAVLARGVAMLDGEGAPDLAYFVEGVEAALDEALPFWREHLLSRGEPVLGGERYDPPDPALGVAGLREVLPLRNAALCGPQVYPGFGVHGELMAALAVAERLGGQDRKKQILAEG